MLKYVYGKRKDVIYLFLTPFYAFLSVFELKEGGLCQLCLHLTNRLMMHREFYRIGNEAQLMGPFM